MVVVYTEFLHICTLLQSTLRLLDHQIPVAILWQLVDVLLNKPTAERHIVTGKPLQMGKECLVMNFLLVFDLIGDRPVGQEMIGIKQNEAHDCYHQCSWYSRAVFVVFRYSFLFLLRLCWNVLILGAVNVELSGLQSVCERGLWWLLLWGVDVAFHTNEGLVGWCHGCLYII